MNDEKDNSFSVVVNDGETIDEIVARMCENYRRIDESNCRIILEALDEIGGRHD